MPAWASALLAAIGAGFLGAWFTARHDRRERFRDRMIEAADDFGIAASQALVAARNALRAASDAKGPAMSARNFAWETRDLALMRSSRLDLLFGPDTKAVAHAHKLVEALGGVGVNLDASSFDLPKAHAAFRLATHRLYEFNRAAHLEIAQIGTPASLRLLHFGRLTLKRAAQEELPAGSDDVAAPGP
jgi:hypothetical protein